MGLIKTPTQIENLKIAGQHLKAVFTKVEPLIKAGSTPLAIDTAAHQEMLKLKCRPSFLHYQGFPNATCISVNDQVVHAIPNNNPFLEGDIVTLDMGLWYENVCVDSARTYGIGKISADAQTLLNATKQALELGVKQALAGNRVGAISHAIEKVARKNNLGIIRSYTGHGVGTAVHEEPSIPNYGRPSDGMLLTAGMVLAIEPMFTLGGSEIVTLSDGWTVITNDRSKAAQFEHTIIVNEKGNEILV